MVTHVEALTSLSVPQLELASWSDPRCATGQGWASWTAQGPVALCRAIVQPGRSRRFFLDRHHPGGRDGGGGLLGETHLVRVRVRVRVRASVRVRVRVRVRFRVRVRVRVRVGPRRAAPG